MLKKYVFIQDDPFFLPKVFDKYLREFADTTLGVNVQSIAIHKRTKVHTARILLAIYGWRYFQWKVCKFLVARLRARVFNRWLGCTSKCHDVRAVAKKYGVPVDDTENINSEEFRALLRNRGVDLIVSISGTQFYGRQLREQTPAGIINCHGGMLPKYRGLMPSFWTLANNERQGGVTVHFVDAHVDNGPIIVQRCYRIHPHDTLEEIMARSKDLAAETIIDAVRMIESGSAPRLANRESEATSYSIPKREDVKRFLATGHRFF